jgi:hypothetical protein
MSTFPIKLTIGGKLKGNTKENLIDTIHGTVFDTDEEIEDLLSKHTSGPLIINGFIEDTDENMSVQALTNFKIPFHLHLDQYGEHEDEVGDWFWLPGYKGVHFKGMKTSVVTDEFIPLMNLMLDMIEHGIDKALPLHVHSHAVKNVVHQCIENPENTMEILRMMVLRYIPSEVIKIPDIPDLIL